MTSKEALKKLEYSTNWSSDEDIDEDVYNRWGNVACRTIKKDLDRLEKLNHIFSDNHICEIKARFNEIECNADKCDTCPLSFESDICLKLIIERKWELQEENFELRQKLNTEEECCAMLQKAIDKYKKAIKEVIFRNKAQQLSNCFLSSNDGEKEIVKIYNETLQCINNTLEEVLKDE